MKTTIRTVLPGWGFDYVELEYKTGGVHEKTRYHIISAWRLHYGKPVQEINVRQLISMTSQEELEKLIIDSTQGQLKKGLEAFDWKQSPPKKEGVKKFSFKNRKQIPD